MEATQAGDIDRSVGKNNFRRIGNPGYSQFALEQNGLVNNEYVMKITGIKPDSSYLFSCWVAWDENYNGDNHIVSFDTVSSENIEEGDINVNIGTNQKIGLPPIANTDARGSFLDGEDSRILSTKQFGGLTWYKLYSFVATDGNADLGTILIHVGKNVNNFNPSMNPLGKRYFTDLRFQKVSSLFDSSINDVLEKLKSQSNLGSVFKYYDIKSKPGKEIIQKQEQIDTEVSPTPDVVIEGIGKIEGVGDKNIVDGAIFED